MDDEANRRQENQQRTARNRATRSQEQETDRQQADGQETATARAEESTEHEPFILGKRLF